MAHLNRSRAVRLTRVAQGGAVLVAGTAIGLLAIRFDPPAPAPVAAWPEPPRPVDEPGEASSLPPPDAFYLGGLFNEIGRITPPAEPEAPVVAASDPAPVTPTEPSAVRDGSVRFIGAMLAGSSSFAVLTTPEGQRIVRQGERVPGMEARVVAITRDELTIETDAGRQTLERELSSGAVVSTITASAPTAAGDPARGGTNRRALLEQAANAAGNPDAERAAFRAEVERRRQELERERKLREGD